MKTTIHMLLLAGLTLTASSSAWAQDNTMVVFTSGETDRSRAIVDTFKGAGDLDATTLSFDLGTDEEEAYFVAESLQGFEATMIFAVGDIALKVAAREFRNIPIIYADAASSTAAAIGRADVIEVEQRVDPGQLLDALTTLSPQTDTFATIYSVQDQSPYWALLEEAADARGLKFVSARVANPFEVRSAQATVSAKADWLLLQPDARLWTPNTLASLYGSASLDQLPVIGFDESHFDSPQPPSLVAITDAEGLGNAAAAMARQVFVEGRAFTDVEVRYAEPIIIGNKRQLQRVGVPLTKKAVKQVDRWDEEN